MAAEFFADFLDRLPDKYGLLPAKVVPWREAGPPSLALEREVRHAMIALIEEGRGILVVALKPGFFSSIDGEDVVDHIKAWAAAALEEVVLGHGKAEKCGRNRWLDAGVYCPGLQLSASAEDPFWSRA